jgi:hypothetical protein
MKLLKSDLPVFRSVFISECRKMTAQIATGGITTGQITIA